jgi:hypothetical protein
MSARHPLPSQDVLRGLLDYDPLTGSLWWRATGEPAFQLCNGDRYWSGQLLGVKCRAHRVIWKWMTGGDPDVVDHINGDGRDNRWENLRAVDQLTNGKNHKLHAHNKSGIMGVRFHKRQQRWVAYIKVAQHQHCLGSFREIGDAISARHAAERRFGFHPNHGRRA